MAEITTARYEEMVLEVEFDPVNAADTYTRVAGLKDVTVTRTSQTETDMVPDETDESKPYSERHSVTSLSVGVSGSGTWALSSHNTMMTWWRSGQNLNARLRNAKVEADGNSGDIYEEQGPAILTQLNHSRGNKGLINAEVSIQFDGLPDAGTRI
ncbi:MAG: phage tail tube protein [Pseudomonadota bacterium]